MSESTFAAILNFFTAVVLPILTAASSALAAWHSVKTRGKVDETHAVATDTNSRVATQGAKLTDIEHKVDTANWPRG